MKKIVSLISFLVMVILLSACSIGEKNEKKLFDAMKEEDLLDFDCEYEDYDEVRQVDQSPIPDVITYYDYIFDDATYSLDYRSVNIGDDEYVYQVRVEKSCDNRDDEYCDIYYFDKETFEFIKKKGTGK